MHNLVRSEHRFSLAIVVVLLLACIAYGGGVRNGFVWDDETFIVKNPFVHDLSRWREYFSDPRSVSDVPVLSRMYRPLQTLSFAIDDALWGGRAGGFHLTSLVLHLGVCLAIVFAFSGLVGRWPSVVAAGLFAVHPAVSEGVLSLAARGNQLYTLFALLSLGCFVKVARAYDAQHILSVVAAAIAFFSKEPAIALVVLLPVIQALCARPWKAWTTRSFLLHTPYVACAVLYLAARSAVVEPARLIPSWGGSMVATALMQAKVFLVYLRLLVWPYYLKGRYSIATPDLWAVAAVLGNLALVATAVVAYRRGGRGRFVALAILWFYLSLAPVSNVIPLPGSMLGERFLYFTCAGVFPFLAGAAGEIAWRRYWKPGVLIVTLLLLSYLAADIRRTGIWRDNARFFELLSRQEPDNPVVQVRMAMEELKTGSIGPAVGRLERIVKAGVSGSLIEDHRALYYWYGVALLRADRPAEAYRQFSAVASLNPAKDVDLAVKLAESAARSGDLGTARSILEREIKGSPQDGTLWNGLGNVLLLSGDTAGAISSYRKALQIEPGNREAALNLQSALQRANRPGS